MATVIRGRDVAGDSDGGGIDDMLVVLPQGRSVADVLEKVGEELWYGRGGSPLSCTAGVGRHTLRSPVGRVLFRREITEAGLNVLIPRVQDFTPKVHHPPAVAPVLGGVGARSAAAVCLFGSGAALLSKTSRAFGAERFVSLVCA